MAGRTQLALATLAAQFCCVCAPPAPPPFPRSLQEAQLALVHRTAPHRSRLANSTTLALRFPLPAGCPLPIMGGAAPACPISDESYCDEFRSLDTDCSGLLILGELSLCETMPNFASIKTVAMHSTQAYVRVQLERRWADLFQRYDRDNDRNLTMIEWLELRGHYTPTFSSCGAAMRDPRHTTADVLPIKPCDTCGTLSMLPPPLLQQLH
eukprot:COSAG01_NODE_54_length_31327_cov_317.045356_11_plen_210_part_00